MSRKLRQLEADRVARNSARDTFDARLAQVRRDVDARGVGARIADRIGQDARDVVDEALETANENRGIIAGTIVAIAIWIFRNPIIARIEGMMAGEED